MTGNAIILKSIRRLASLEHHLETVDALQLVRAREFAQKRVPVDKKRADIRECTDSGWLPRPSSYRNVPNRRLWTQVEE